MTGLTRSITKTTNFTNAEAKSASVTTGYPFQSTKTTNFTNAEAKSAQRMTDYPFNHCALGTCIFLTCRGGCTISFSISWPRILREPDRLNAVPTLTAIEQHRNGKGSGDIAAAAALGAGAAAFRTGASPWERSGALGAAAEQPEQTELRSPFTSSTTYFIVLAVNSYLYSSFKNYSVSVTFIVYIARVLLPT